MLIESLKSSPSILSPSLQNDPSLSNSFWPLNLLWKIMPVSARQVNANVCHGKPGPHRYEMVCLVRETMTSMPTTTTDMCNGSPMNS